MARWLQVTLSELASVFSAINRSFFSLHSENSENVNRLFLSRLTFNYRLNLQLKLSERVHASRLCELLAHRFSL